MDEKRNHLRLAGLIGLLIVATTGLWQGRSLDWQGVAQWTEDLGSLAWLVFMAIYAVATVALLPGSVFSLAGGALFGPVSGTFVNLTGATIGAVLAFLMARYLGGLATGTRAPAPDWAPSWQGWKRKAGGSSPSPGWFPCPPSIFSITPWA
uniref:TVP38/TMEM64 family membrane protein n=1 Tax=Candidatus Kentrum sp. LFY TaxID=2126342 RepID=A0A450V581_9GAMM|nr:MAG: SNARE associated Golgi protein [Candidatus Kentron sp. LFY]